MLTYLIEDDPLKASRLQSFLADRFPQLEVVTHGSFHSGLQAIEEEKPALVILDMTLPTFDRSPSTREGRLRPLGGYDLMRKLRRQGRAPAVVVITQLETFGEGSHPITLAEITATCSKEFPNMFLGSVYYHPTSSAWSDALVEIINGVIEGNPERG